MTDCTCSEPLTDLDERLDDLCRSLVEFRDLHGFIRVLDRAIKTKALGFDLDHPDATEALFVANVFGALRDVAGEIIKLQEGPR